MIFWCDIERFLVMLDCCPLGRLVTLFFDIYRDIRLQETVVDLLSRGGPLV